MNTSSLLLYGTKLSGHTHRVELFLRLLGLPYEYAQAGADVRTSDAFKRLNPLGQIPVLQDGDVTVADSTAILVYLCKRYAPDSSWLPGEAVPAAAVQRWLSIAANELANGPAAARAAALFKAPNDVARAHAIAQRLLVFMEGHLTGRDFLAASHPTIADLACYAYIARAPEGGVSLDGFSALGQWLARVEALPGFLPMPGPAA